MIETESLATEIGTETRTENTKRTIEIIQEEKETLQITHTHTHTDTMNVTEITTERKIEIETETDIVVGGDQIEIDFTLLPAMLITMSTRTVKGEGVEGGASTAAQVMVEEGEKAVEDTVPGIVGVVDVDVTGGIHLVVDIVSAHRHCKTNACTRSH